jgi:hypothetical protein
LLQADKSGCEIFDAKSCSRILTDSNYKGDITNKAIAKISEHVQKDPEETIPHIISIVNGTHDESVMDHFCNILIEQEAAGQKFKVHNGAIDNIMDIEQNKKNKNEDYAGYDRKNLKFASKHLLKIADSDPKTFVESVLKYIRYSGVKPLVEEVVRTYAEAEKAAIEKHGDKNKIVMPFSKFKDLIVPVIFSASHDMDLLEYAGTKLKPKIESQPMSVFAVAMLGVTRKDAGAVDVASDIIELCYKEKPKEVARIVSDRKQRIGAYYKDEMDYAKSDKETDRLNNDHKNIMANFKVLEEVLKASKENKGKAGDIMIYENPVMVIILGESKASKIKAGPSNEL